MRQTSSKSKFLLPPPSLQNIQRIRGAPAELAGAPKNLNSCVPLCIAMSETNPCAYYYVKFVLELHFACDQKIFTIHITLQVLFIKTKFKSPA